MTAALRTGLTLAGLALLVVLAVTWGFHQTTRPFPTKSDPPICTDIGYDKGDKIATGDVTVNVLNAGARAGLAGRTMQLLKDQGFSAGVTKNAPEDTKVDSAEIWTSDRSDPSIRMLRSYVGKVPVQVRDDLPYAGLNLVIGDQFGDLAAGRATIIVRKPGSICTPASAEPSS